MPRRTFNVKINNTVRRVFRRRRPLVKRRVVARKRTTLNKRFTAVQKRFRGKPKVAFNPALTTVQPLPATQPGANGFFGDVIKGVGSVIGDVVKGGAEIGHDVLTAIDTFSSSTLNSVHCPSKLLAFKKYQSYRFNKGITKMSKDLTIYANKKGDMTAIHDDDGVKVNATDVARGDILYDLSISPVDINNSRLSKKAELYQRYIFNSFTIEYHPAAGGLRDGALICFFDTDPYAVPPTGEAGIRYAMAHNGQDVQIAHPQNFNLPIIKDRTFYTSDTYYKQDDRFRVQGKFYVMAATSLPADVPIGQFKMDYSCQFSVPSLPDANTVSDTGTDIFQWNLGAGDYTYTGNQTYKMISTKTPVSPINDGNKLEWPNQPKIVSIVVDPVNGVKEGFKIPAGNYHITGQILHFTEGTEAGELKQVIWNAAASTDWETDPYIGNWVTDGNVTPVWGAATLNGVDVENPPSLLNLSNATKPIYAMCSLYIELDVPLLENEQSYIVINPKLAFEVNAFQGQPPNAVTSLGLVLSFNKLGGPTSTTYAYKRDNQVTNELQLLRNEMENLRVLLHPQSKNKSKLIIDTVLASSSENDDDYIIPFKASRQEKGTKRF